MYISVFNYVMSVGLVLCRQFNCCAPLLEPPLCGVGPPGPWLMTSDLLGWTGLTAALPSDLHCRGVPLRHVGPVSGGGLGDALSQGAGCCDFTRPGLPRILQVTLCIIAHGVWECLVKVKALMHGLMSSVKMTDFSQFDH